MPEVLLLARDSKSSFVIEERARACGFRIKTTFESSLALEWLALREFDVALVYDGISSDLQKELSTLLWRKNPLSPLVLFNLEANSSTSESQALLSGVELAAGEGALTVIDKIFASIRPRESVEGGQFKVLVVEDLDAPRDIICTYLESLGFNSVVGVGSAKEALALLQGEPHTFSCIVTDIRMPQMSGEEFITQVRMHPKISRLPIVVLTAHGTMDCLVDCLKAGASGFLVKPPKKADLTREMARAFRISKSGSDPRLATKQEADELLQILAERGFSE